MHATEEFFEMLDCWLDDAVYRAVIGICLFRCVLQGKLAYKEYMERQGYHTVKELHNNHFYVKDYIFISNRLYNRSE